MSNNKWGKVLQMYSNKYTIRQLLSYAMNVYYWSVNELGGHNLVFLLIDCVTKKKTTLYRGGLQ
jgi:hypothetical protein